MVLSQNTKRDSGKNVQAGNINAGKAIGDVVRTCLGPRAMLKMLMDPMGGIVMTNDGNAILREITVQVWQLTLFFLSLFFSINHAKSMTIHTQYSLWRTFFAFLSVWDPLKGFLSRHQEPSTLT